MKKNKYAASLDTISRPQNKVGIKKTDCYVGAAIAKAIEEGELRNHERLVRIAQELIDLGENVGNFKIKPSEIIYDISGHTPRTIEAAKAWNEAAKAWNVLSEVLTLHRQKYSNFNPDYKAEALLTGIYHNCVFLVSENFWEADLIGVSSRLRLQGHKVATFKQVK